MSLYFSIDCCAINFTNSNFFYDVSSHCRCADLKKDEHAEDELDDEEHVEMADEEDDQNPNKEDDEISDEEDDEIFYENGMSDEEYDE